ncbi:MAG: pyridoxamine 5'-phosphate oxidase family protein [Candidatus Nomurabacteria bacterium]|nr:pyridoxamine 5'-phosphate oxidase family protein [Candidatus Nomurabacteria bacterium]
MDQKILKAKEILESSPYLVIASVDKNSMPNNSPMFSAYDEKYNFYWNSQIDSKHSENIRNNPNVFCVIFNSSVKEGDGSSVYMEGKAYELNEKEETRYAMKVFYAKKGKDPKPEELYLGDSPRRFYKFVPNKFFINTYEKINGLPVDGKVEIKL